jgi:polyhydroxyalkanoate synthesis regulator phasin
MAQNDMLKRYLDAGVAFTKMSRSRAEGIVNDLVRAGEIQREQAQQRVDDLMDRSRRNTEHLVELVRRELREQLAAMGLATKNDISRIESRLDALSRSNAGAGAAKKAPAASSAAAPAPAGTAARAKKAAPAKPAKKAGPAKGAKKA